MNQGRKMFKQIATKFMRLRFPGVKILLAPLFSILILYRVSDILD